MSGVPRGKECGCICPSCKTPLIAKQGPEKQWHFAHASRDVYTQTKKECEYSFFVSVRLMARQIINSTLSIKLPEYSLQAEKYLTEDQHYLNVPYTVTPQRNVAISDVKIEKIFMGLPVDIFGHVQEYSFILYFTHPGRRVPVEFNAPNDKRCGIVSISLEPTHALFAKAKENNSSYKAELYNYLENDLKSKEWVFHPRQQHCEKLANEKIQQQIAEFVKNRTVVNVRKHSNSVQPETEVTKVENVPRKMANFECIICYSEWKGLEPSDSACPKCKTHLYRRFKGYVQE